MSKKDINLTELGYLSPITHSVNTTFDPNNPVIRGKAALLQRIVKGLLTIKGTNSFNKEMGSFYTKYIGTLQDADSISELIPVILQELSEQIILEQDDDKTLPPGEKLLSLTLEDIILDEARGRANVHISVTTEDNLKTTFIINE